MSQFFRFLKTVRIRFFIAALALSLSSIALAKESIPAKPVGFVLGLIGGVVWHETGHFLVAESVGWETVGFQIGKIGSDGVGGAVHIIPEGTPESNRAEFLAVFAAGSLGQIFPVLAAPLVRRQTDSPYMQSALDYMSMFGAADFLFYATKDFLFSISDSQVSMKGDWQQFSEISGIPLYAITAVSLVWTGVLINYHKRKIESELHQSDSAFSNSQFDPPRLVPILNIAFSIH